ncbi:MAG TPA: Holliday junction resolvase RuvX [Deltaproteobacteria bacterium]|nr:Holliday junction resolvase RuvX [Deltaproteobacteria bacterium]
MGLDFGTKRIGVAISDPECSMAHPLDTVEVRTDGSHMEKIQAIAREYRIAKVVIGLPYNMDGSIGPSGEKVLLWSEEIKNLLEVPVVFWDERLTTSEAHNLMIGLKVKGRKRRLVVDKIAAGIILKDYLDSL